MLCFRRAAIAQLIAKPVTVGPGRVAPSFTAVPPLSVSHCLPDVRRRRHGPQTADWPRRQPAGLESPPWRLEQVPAYFQALRRPNGRAIDGAVHRDRGPRDPPRSTERRHRAAAKRSTLPPSDASLPARIWLPCGPCRSRRPLRLTFGVTAAVDCGRLDGHTISAIVRGARDPVDRLPSVAPFAGHGISPLAQPGNRCPRRVRKPSRRLGQIDGRRCRPRAQVACGADRRRVADAGRALNAGRVTCAPQSPDVDCGRQRSRPASPPPSARRSARGPRSHDPRRLFHHVRSATVRGRRSAMRVPTAIRNASIANFHLLHSDNTYSRPTRPETPATSIVVKNQPTGT